MTRRAEAEAEAIMLASWNIQYAAAMPISPMPTTDMPITEPLLKATLSAGLRPIIAFTVVRVLALTAMLMPM